MSDCGQGSEQAAQNRFSVSVGDYTARCFLPDRDKLDKIVYMHAAMSGEAERVWQHLSCKCILVGVEGLDWNRDMSPWHHAKVFAKGEDFLGGADAYLSFLCGRIIPEVERELAERMDGLCGKVNVGEEGTGGREKGKRRKNYYIRGENCDVKRYLVGYSLGGLFALYALYHTSLFDGAGTVSGSLWYDGFVSYVEGQALCRKPEKLYFSLGEKEDRGNAKTSCVRVCTERIERWFCGIGVCTFLEYNNGGHFMDVEKRIAKGIKWLTEGNGE